MFYSMSNFKYFGDESNGMSQNGTATLANTALNDSIIGFSTFPDQVFRRCIKDGFEFTLMVVGESGKYTYMAIVYNT
jgi:hypothetical protein